MGFIIWYKLAFPGAGPGGGPLTVSNDVFGGDYVLYADVRLTMTSGATADSFAIKLINLPADVAEKLAAQQIERRGSQNPLQVEISLGYFDDRPLVRPARPVMI